MDILLRLLKSVKDAVQKYDCNVVALKYVVIYTIKNSKTLLDEFYALFLLN